MAPNLDRAAVFTLGVRRSRESQIITIFVAEVSEIQRL
jgi:hypothetical protein